MTANECPIELTALSPMIQKHVSASAPNGARIMAARGLAPMPPRDLVTAQFVLTFDDDARLAKLATDNLGKMDARIANAVLGDEKMPAAVLGYLARTFATHDAYAERLLLNPTTPTDAIVDVAKVASEQICEVISVNQKRILDAPEIARSLDENPNKTAEHRRPGHRFPCS